MLTFFILSNLIKVCLFQHPCTIIEYEIVKHKGNCTHFFGRRACKFGIYIDLLGCLNTQVGSPCMITYTVPFIYEGYCISSESTDFAEDYDTPTMICVGLYGLLGICHTKT